MAQTNSNKTLAHLTSGCTQLTRRGGLAAEFNTLAFKDIQARKQLEYCRQMKASEYFKPATGLK